MIGEIINERYHLNAELGQGGMGIVYLARDTVLNRDVALKLVSSPRLGTDGRSRLLSEAQTVAQLKHPNIVTVYDAGEVENQPYVVMEYIQGDTLDKHQLDGYQQIVDVAKQICTALEYAHSHNIVHRDLKPENVIIQPNGNLQLMDFGLAVSTTSRMTENGLIMGTVAYMSPEQAFGYEVTPASDLYSLGVMLYEMVTGNLPFEADDALGVITQHIHAPVVPPIAKAEDLPGPLNDLIVSLLSKEPDERPASAADVLAVLEDPSLFESAGSLDKELSVLDRIVRGRILGREGEFAEVRSLWLKSIAGQGQTVLISGEPGIGKTRLMREIATNAGVSGGTALIGECYAESNAPYNAFSQIIRQGLQRHHHNGNGLPDAVLDDLLDLTPDLRHSYLDIQANQKLDPESEQQRLFENMVVFCETYSKNSPLLLIVDDAHWGDSGTLAMLHHLIRRTQNLPLMILVTYREVELKEALPFNEMLLELNRQRIGTRLKLKRLNREQTCLMLKAIFAEEISDEFLDGIYHETDGNPFFIEEVCRALVESGAVYYESGEWQRLSMDEMEIPQGVQIAVESRLIKLPEEHQEVLRMASILGREFEFKILLESLDLDEDTLIDALESAEEAQMIAEVDGSGDVTFVFVHALVPSAIMDSVRTLRRRKMHRRAANAIEAISPQDYESLAYHYSEAGDEIQALRYYTQAGERAAAAFANQDAERYFQSALDLVEEEREHADLLTQLGLSQTNQGKKYEAVETWQQAIQIYSSLDEKDLVAELFALSARSTWEGGDTKGGLTICRQGLVSVAGTPDGPGLARLLAETCREYFFNGFPEESGEYGQQALQIAESLNLTLIQVETLTTLGLLDRQLSQQSVKLLEQAVQLADSANLPRESMRAHNNLSVQYIYVNLDFPKAFHHMQLATDLAKRFGDLENELFFRVNVGIWMVLAGKLKEVADLLPTLQDMKNSLPDPGSGGIGLKQLHSWLLSYQGNLDQAFKVIHQRLIDERETGDLMRLAYAHYLIAEISLIAGDIERGKQASKELIGLAEQGMISKPGGYSFLSRVYSRTGEITKARNLLKLAIDALQDPDQLDFDQLSILWAQADLNVAVKDWNDALITYKRLVDLYAKYGFLWHANRVRVDWATALLASGEPGDIEKAHQLLETAIEQDQKMGADGFTQMVAEKLADLEGIK